MISNILIITWL